jgi:ABC-type nitrate/sulfonate/bicarbonate transport system substrate-binding protein
MDPRKDIEWVDAQSYDAMMPSFIDGQADAVLAFPPHPQYLRAKPANTSFTYVGSYADSRMACQFIAWQLARGFENMKPSAGEA